MPITTQRQLEGLNKEEKKEFKKAIEKYDLDKLYNFTLDSFSLRGEINTPENVLRDLKKIPKKVESEVGDNIYLKSKDQILHFGFLEFVVEIKYNLPKKGYATVYLILKEPVKKAGGLFIDYNYNNIAHLVLPNDKYLFEKIATEFNIGGTLNGRSRTEIDYEPLAVLQAKRYLYILAGHVVFATCSENLRYLENRLNLLKETDLGKKILQEFNRILPHISNTLTYEHIIFAQNQLLTTLLRQYEELFSNDRRLYMNLTLLNAEYRTNINNIAEEISHYITVENSEEHLPVPATREEDQARINAPIFNNEDELTM